MRARCLITGGAGQLARDLLASLPGAHAPARAELSILDADAVRSAISTWRAEVVFNCAAYNAVDLAEQEPEAAMLVNATGAANVARACRLEGARLVHFSTNYVFSGSAQRPYTELDEPDPVNVYGRSKREGELRVQDALPEALIIRSSGLFGIAGSKVKGGSLPDRLLARAEAGQPLSVVDDQLLNPTYTGHLAEASIGSLEAGRSGILHLVAAGCCSYHEFAVEVLRLAGIAAPVEPIATPAGGASRPRNGCLASLELPPLPPWQEGLAAYWAAKSSALPRLT